MDLHGRLSRVSGFQSDAGDIEKNWHSHQVASAECEQVFFNRPLIAATDVVHSEVEERFFCLAQTHAGRLLFIAFTLRGELVRVISARDMSRKERKACEVHG
ncbi:MAG: BrnT family toxin [Gemmatimonas sp.]|nr:BrnT family toxin [Gemmatimonas sp.]